MFQVSKKIIKKPRKNKTKQTSKQNVVEMNDVVTYYDVHDNKKRKNTKNKTQQQQRLDQ